MVLHPVVPRRRSPVVFVAYGDGGGAWLRAAAGRCAASPVVRELIEHGIVQFWWIAGRGEPPAERCRVWPELPSLGDAAAALDQARSAHWTATYPDLSVREVLVVERVSLFAPGVAARREALHALLARVPGVDGQASQGEQGFRYRWVTLADAVHDPTRTDADGRAQAGQAAVASPADALVFLVDRQDSDVAVIDGDLASRCLAELALAFVHGDLGAPRRDGVDVSLRGVVRDAVPGHVVPFSVGVLEHPWREIETARARSFRDRLAAGVPDRSTLERAYGSPRHLLDALERERAALDRGTYDAATARRARREPVEVTIAWALADGDARWVRGLVADVRRETARLTVSNRGTMTTAAIAGAFITAPVATTDSVADSLRGAAAAATADGGAKSPWSSVVIVVSALAAVAVGVLATLYLTSRRRVQQAVGDDWHGAPAYGATNQTEAREDARREWERLCDQLDALLDEWERVCRGVRSADGDLPAPLWRPNPPVAWRLTSDALRLLDDGVVATAELCRDVARRCEAQFDGRTPPATILEEACRQELRRWDARRHPSESAPERYLRAALSPARTGDVRRFVEARPYLANPATPLQRELIVWLTAPPLHLDTVLLALEPAAAQSAAVARSHDDDERSVRLAFARPVPWAAFPSLAPLSPDVAVDASRSAR